MTKTTKTTQTATNKELSAGSAEITENHKNHEKDENHENLGCKPRVPQATGLEIPEHLGAKRTPPRRGVPQLLVRSGVGNALTKSY